MAHDDISRVMDKLDEMSHTITELRIAMTELKSSNDENTTFRKRAVNGIVGTAFLAICALGVAVLKITGVLHLTK